MKPCSLCPPYFSLEPLTLRFHVVPAELSSTAQVNGLVLIALFYSSEHWKWLQLQPEAALRSEMRLAAGLTSASLQVVDVHVRSGYEAVLQQHLHQLGAGRLTGEQLSLRKLVTEQLPDAGISCSRASLLLHGCVQRSWVSAENRK